MTDEIQKSDSEPSSDPSWTFINGSEATSRRGSADNVRAEAENDKTTKELLEEPLNISEVIPVEDKEQFKNTKKEKVRAPKPKRKTRKNEKKKKGTDSLNLLSIAACLLTVAGLSLLTSLLPVNLSRSADVENMQNQLAELYEYTNNLSSEGALSSLQATMETLETARSTDLLNLVSQNISNDETCDADYYNNSLTPEDISELRIRIIAPYSKEMFEQLTNTDESEALNSTQSLFESTNDFLKSPTLQIFIATLIQDLCLIKLISEFTKRNKEETEEESKCEKKSVSKISKIFRKIKKEKTDDKAKKIRKSRLVTKTHSMPVHGLVSSIARSSENNEVVNNENGKSECERRFEELEHKWSALGETHRQKVQQIKSKFQKEILEINEHEKESLNRQQKIRSTREKFIQKLRADREVFLNRLKKLREERQKVLTNVCQNVKKSRSLCSKDVSVGNYAVLIPSDYDFWKKLQDIKLKEDTENGKRLEAVNNEGTSYVPMIDANPISIELEESSENCSVTEESRKTRNKTRNIYEIKKKHQSKKDRLIKKRQEKHHVKEVQNVVASIVNSLSEATAILVANGSKTCNLPFTADVPDEEHKIDLTAAPPSTPVNIEEDDGFLPVQRRKATKRNVAKLYEIAFEEQSKKIRQQDLRKWEKQFNDEQKWSSMEFMKKKDHQKSHKPKMMHNGVLWPEQK